tara:strand:- start:6425 stop:6721 length:297 start_codon:yes stop_codon:yes gene_type:complete
MHESTLDYMRNNMNIEFKGSPFLGDTTEINFLAMVDGKSITCIVTFEALEDINPGSKSDDGMLQYINNEDKLKAIAEKKIRNGQVTSNKVVIYSADVI